MGLKTVMLNVPAAVKSVAGIVAVSWVEVPKVVPRLEPAKRTTEPLTKFVPFTVSVNPGSPTVLAVGEMLEVVGTPFAVTDTLPVVVPLREPCPEPLSVHVVLLL